MASDRTGGRPVGAGRGPPDWVLSKFGAQVPALPLGPFPTAFLPAQGCMSEIHGYNYYATPYTTTLPATTEGAAGPTTVVDVKPWHSLGLTGLANCYPSGFVPAPTAFFSPAVSCPTGWSTANRVLSSVAGDVVETKVACCPGGYAYTEATEPWLSTVPCRSSATEANAPLVTVTVPGPNAAAPAITTVLTNPVVHAAAIFVRYQPSDLVAASVQTSPATSPSSGPQQTSATEPSPPAGNSLSREGVLAIAISLSILSILLIAGLLLFWRSRRRRAAAEATVDTTNKSSSSVTSDEEAIMIDSERTPTVTEMDRTPITTSTNQTPTVTEMDSSCDRSISFTSAGWEDNQKYPAWNLLEGPLSRIAHPPLHLRTVLGQVPSGRVGLEMCTPSNTHEMIGTVVPLELPGHDVKGR